MLNYDAITIEEATALQNELRQRVSLLTIPGTITTIAGGDISHNKNTDVIYAGMVVLSYPEMQLLSYSLIEAKTKFPYVPQYLGFREIPALLEAWYQIPLKPDIVVLDGQGITHPREMGIACHFGVLANQAAIGCAKNMLFGKYNALPLEKLHASPIVANDSVKGFALRTKEGVKPVYISPGHKVSVKDSLEIMKACVKRHRIPEPTRLAHDIVNRFRIGQLKEGFTMCEI